MGQDNLKRLPKTHTKEIFVHLRVAGYLAGNFYCAQSDMTDIDKEVVLLTSKEVTFDIPQDIDVKGEVIKNLENEKEKIQAETHMKLKDIQDKIDNLLAIEYKP